MGGKALHQRVAAVRMMFSMWLTEDVVAKRADHLTDAERTVMAKCALCGKEAKGRRNEHLLFECTAAGVVHSCRILRNTSRNSKILEVLRGASILRVFLRNTRRLVIFFYQLLQESFLLKNHKNRQLQAFLCFRAKLYRGGGREKTLFEVLVRAQ